MEGISSVRCKKEFEKTLHKPDVEEDLCQEGYKQLRIKEEESEIQSQANINDNSENSSECPQSSNSVENDRIIKSRRLKRKKKTELLPNKSQSQRADTDPVDSFLAVIGPTLKSLEPILLNQAKCEIFSVVQEFEMKQFKNASDDLAQNSSLSSTPSSTSDA